MVISTKAIRKTAIAEKRELLIKAELAKIASENVSTSTRENPIVGSISCSVLPSSAHVGTNNTCNRAKNRAGAAESANRSAVSNHDSGPRGRPRTRGSKHTRIALATEVVAKNRREGYRNTAR